MDLLWDGKMEYESIIEENVFSDLLIINLFEKFRRNIYDILEIIKFIPSKDKINYRKKIFDDFLLDYVGHFNEIKKLADDVINAYKIYISSAPKLKKNVNFLLYITKYIIFYEKSQIFLNCMDIKSEGIIILKEHINMVSFSLEFIALKHDVENFDLNKIKKFIVYNKNRGIIFEDLDEVNTLNSLLMQLADEISSQINYQSKSYSLKGMDSAYMQVLEKLYSKESKFLEDIHSKYSNITFSLDQLSTHIDYYLFFKSLFLECKLPYCVPSLSNNIIKFSNSYDISLYGLTDEIIPNDVCIDNINVITGVNGGGKTSFLRSIGINYILFFSVGHVFAQTAELKMLRHIYTHFPNNEDYKIGYGRLKDELYRLEKISMNFNDNCLLLLNETFSSTDEENAYIHAKSLINKIKYYKTYCVYVTHHQKIIEIAGINVYIPLIDENNRKLFKIVRKEEDVNMDTYDILYRYGLTKKQLITRLKNEKI